MRRWWDIDAKDDNDNDNKETKEDGRGGGEGGGEEKRATATTKKRRRPPPSRARATSKTAAKPKRTRASGGGGGGPRKARRIGPLPPLPAQPLGVRNFVCSARMIRLGRTPLECATFARSGFRFPFKAMVDALLAWHANDSFACATLKETPPQVCCHAYSSGRIIACGALSEADAIYGMKLILHRLRVVFGWQLRLLSYRLSNVVSSMAVGYSLDLDRIYADYSDKCRYGPIDFPGLNYFPNGFAKPRPCFIVYSSGAVVIVGTRSASEASAIADAIDWRRYEYKSLST